MANKPLLVWGIVLLATFLAAHSLYVQGYNVAWTWIGIAVVINLVNMWVGKQMKRGPKGTMEMWMSAGIFGLVTTVIVALGYIPVNVVWLMSLWLLLIGGAMAGGGLVAKNPLGTYTGFVTIIASLFAPGFGGWYLMTGALFLGGLNIINALVSK